MLGIEPWPSARAVSTLSHRSSLQKSSLFSFVGFLRQNRHSGVLTGCCVLTAGIKPHGNVPASLSLFRVGSVQSHASPQEGNGGHRAHCWSLSIPTTRRNLTQPPFAGYTCSCTHWITRSAAECRVCSHETLTSGTPWGKGNASKPRKPCFS